jgi:hypothetical protein
MKKRLALCALLCLAFVSVEGQTPIDVCGLLKSAKLHEGKTVTATGFVFADRHSTGIGGEGCSGGIVIRYDSGRVPRDFVDGVEAKRGRFDSRPFNVTVEGKFSSHVRGPLGYLRRIEVTKVLHWEFVDAAPASHNP